MTVKDTLIKARAIVAAEHGWATGAWYTVPNIYYPPGDAYNEALDALAPEPGACSACAEGAIAIACGIARVPHGIDYKQPDFANAIELFMKANDIPRHDLDDTGGWSINKWNDALGMTQAKVVAAFDKAIARWDALNA